MGKTPKQITERLASSRDEDKDGFEACFTSVHENGGRKSGPDLPQVGTALRGIDRKSSAIPGCSLSGHLHSWLSSYLESQWPGRSTIVV